jgi:vacuolar protein sorting-associated protein 54
MHISKQISTKANTFFHAMTSQDEVQEHVLKTCTAVKKLRNNMADLDERSVLTSIRVLKLINAKLKYKSLIEKVNLKSLFSVHYRYLKECHNKKKKINNYSFFELNMNIFCLQLNLMASVYQTQPTIQIHLSSSEFTGALDQIALSQDILRQDLRGIRSLRHYDSQFGEVEKAIDKMLHQEFAKYIVSDFSRPYSDGSDILNQVNSTRNLI